MSILMIISVVFFLLSLFVHLGSSFHFYHASKEIMMLIGFYGILVSFYPMAYILSKTSRELSKEKYRKFMLDICPRWMTLAVGFLIFYALANAVYYFASRQLADVPADNQLYSLDAKYRTLSSLWMVLHFLIFTMLYGCRYLKKFGYPQRGTE